MLKSVKSGVKAKEVNGVILCGKCDSQTQHMNPNKGMEEYYCSKCHLSFIERAK